jgi:hypothetical protein
MPIPTVNFRIEPELWEAARQAAAKEDRTVSYIIRRFLREYVQYVENHEDAPEVEIRGRIVREAAS